MRLAVDGFATLQHGDKFGDLSGPRLGALDGADAVEDRVSVRALQRCKETRGPRVGLERILEVGGDFRAASRSVGRSPPTIGLASICAVPDSRIRPSAISAVARLLLTSDHLLRAFRGVKRTSQ